MRFAVLFVWIALPAAGYVAYAMLGLPHVSWTYSFYDNGAPYDPLAARTYIDCTFWGPYGRFTVPAEAGRCPWIEFFKPASDQ